MENLWDLRRLRLVLKAIPDESLMRMLEDERGRGRDDYPIRPVWNSVSNTSSSGDWPGCSLALVVTLAMALGRIREKQKE